LVPILSLLEASQRSSRRARALSPRVAPLWESPESPRAAALVLAEAGASAATTQLNALYAYTPRAATLPAGQPQLPPKSHAGGAGTVTSRAGGLLEVQKAPVNLSPGALPHPRRACLPADLQALARVPTQMFVAVAVACLLFTFRTPYAFFDGKGIWSVITVILVLEPTMGATAKKVKLRMVGTILGGALGAAIVGLALVVNRSWASPPGGDALPKSLTVALGVAGMCWALQARRLRDPSREYAYSVAMLTMAITSLNDFYDDDWLSVRTSVWWRCCTIVTGVVICSLVGALVLPVFAGDVAREALAESLRLAASLLSGVVDAYLVAEGMPGRERAPSAERHQQLHSLEAGLSLAMEHVRPALQQAAEETRCAARPLPVERYTLAAGRARLLYTGAVALLHFLESDFIRTGLCARHSDVVCAARDAVGGANASVAQAVLHDTLSAAAVAPALSAAEQAVAALLAVAASELPSHAADETRTDTEIAAVTAADVESLGHLCFALADALRQLKLLVSDIDPAGRRVFAEMERLHALPCEEPRAPDTNKMGASKPRGSMVSMAARRRSIIS